MASKRITKELQVPAPTDVAGSARNQPRAGFFRRSFHESLFGKNSARGFFCRVRLRRSSPPRLRQRRTLAVDTDVMSDGVTWGGWENTVAWRLRGGHSPYHVTTDETARLGQLSRSRHARLLFAIVPSLTSQDPPPPCLLRICRRILQPRALRGRARMMISSTGTQPSSGQRTARTKAACSSSPFMCVAPSPLQIGRDRFWGQV
jgi:hypothetical protein